MTIACSILAAQEPSVSIFKHFVVAGGWITWFVLIPLSVISLGMMLHYLLTIRRGTLAPVKLGRALVNAARQGQREVVAELTREDESLLGVGTFAAVSQLDRGVEAAKAAADEAIEERVTRLFRRIEYLNVIGNVSPMIGLFGTVVGMIQAFNTIFAAGGGMPQPSILARDIAVALVTTFWGLLIAIPALTAFAIFRNRVDAYAAESIKLCDGLVAKLSEGPSAEKPQDSRVPVEAK
ncbi:MAG TPA: MotA/TolQ/ExbB proton channel family protein [Phycisphaerae bacterium]|jgi:biopolymer transport protein ExbB|nr:MotA/TolQ/ExbB proton channel family protein [Phycisphaerae bacterium]HOB73574.1 MotA/TolQ/ExbB proton channel family protein [Phycisphaerae bacterium]HOJ55805.1 MotA/TolQ/ExbB proton channel family protein [Phycisphaerae bacterium]HOL25827.1 MotA/TolQ/ExbB proton channel family protein [Phycisphaerae bacterium]HPP21299.1 MotA/TolQ/ExbB proton channel family protein [Phycisphaerae bacterium]